MRVVYLDANALSHVAEHPEIWPAFRTWLRAQHAWIALTDAHLAELHDADRKHGQVARIFASMPSFVGRNGEQLLREELQAYPGVPEDPFPWHPVSSLVDPENEIRERLASAVLAEGRVTMLHNADHMSRTLTERLSTFPTGRSGKYTADQVGLYVHQVVVERLARVAPQFLVQHQSEEIRMERFRSLLAGPAVAFYKYYVERREPRRRSDLGDQLHLQYFPYSDVVVTEKDVAETLRQAGSKIPELATIEVRTLDFVKEFA